MYRRTLKALGIAATAAFSGVASAAITGTAHDLSTETWDATGQICIYCHTPHNGDAATSSVPLWNHESTASTFTMYDSTVSSTFDATAGTAPDGASLACLSCHDGSVALDSFGSSTGTNYLTGTALLSTDLSNDHPISFTYDSTLATTDGELEDPSTATGIGTGTIEDTMLFSGKMQCASCHDVHDDTLGMFLLMDNTGSALCLTCHIK